MTGRAGVSFVFCAWLGLAQPALAAERPNILFAIADDWSFGHAGAYGCGWVKTPAFDRVAREGLLFTRAYTPVAKCAPSRAAILTGRHPWLLEAAANHNCEFPQKFRTYAEVIGDHGYFVGMTSKGWSPGLAKDSSGRPRRMTGQAFNARKCQPPTPEISDNDYAANFADFLDAVPSGVPWCFWYGAIEPHRSYQYGSGAALAAKKCADVDRVPKCWPDNETVRNDMLDYALEVEHFDMHLGRMLDMLEKHGQLSNTFVVVTSDNGMPFPHGKGNVYDGANHLPLAVMWKQGIVEPGRIATEYVSFVDFAPTFVEVAGLEWDRTGMASSTGRSLVDLLSGRGTVRDHVLLGKERTDVGRPNDWGYPTRGIVTGDMLYIHNFEPSRWPGGDPETGYLDTDGSPTKTEVLKTRAIPEKKFFWDVCFGKRPAEELYDLRIDPDCVDNLAGRTATEPFRNRLFDELRAHGDPRMFGRGHVFDEYPYAGERERHFHERYMRGEKITASWVNESDYDSNPAAE